MTQISESLQLHMQRRLHFATDRFDREVRNVAVRLLDVNGPKGGVDKICRLTATLRHGRVISTSAHRKTFYTAITDATKRLRGLLARITDIRKPRPR